MFKSPKIGIFIGIFDILVSIGFTILAIICLVEIYQKTEDGARNVRIALTFTMSISVLVICLPIIIVSSLLIRGSLQRRHSLMVPWIVVNVVGFVFYLTSSIVGFSHPHEGAAIISARCVGIALEALIIYTIFAVYKDVRNTNIQNMLTGQVCYTSRQVPVSRPAATPSNVDTAGEVKYPVLTDKKILVP